MSLLRPEYLSVALPMGLMGAAALWRSGRVNRGLPGTSTSAGARRGVGAGAGAWCWIAGLAAAATALLGPSLSSTMVPAADATSATKALRMEIVLDVSRSMGADTLGVRRLDEARAAISRILGAVPGAEAGLVVFGTTAHRLLPPTQDTDVLRSYLAALEPGLLSRAGSTRSAALDALALAGQETAHVLLVTDGEWWESGEAGMPELGDGPPVHVIWADRPGAAVVGSGTSRARRGSTDAVVQATGGAHVSASDPRGLSALERRLARDAELRETAADEEHPVDASPVAAAVAALLLGFGALFRREL